MKYLLLLLTSNCALFHRELDYSDNLMYPKHKPYGNGYTVSVFCDNKYKEDCLPWGTILDHKTKKYDMILYKVEYETCFDKIKHIVWVKYWCVSPDYSVPRKEVKDK